MPDTEAARAAIRRAYNWRREVNGGLSMAELKLLAAGGLLRDDDPPPYPEDSPVWIDRAANGLDRALGACDALRDAIVAARGEVMKLAEGTPAVVKLLHEHDILPRHRTPDRRNEDGSTTIAVQRCCNGCGYSLGDVTMQELEYGIAGVELPDVRMECPRCRPSMDPPLPEMRSKEKGDD